MNERDMPRGYLERKPSPFGDDNSNRRAEVGMGATIIHYSDRTPCTVIRVSETGKTCWIQEDTYTRADTNGMSESQTYTYAANPAGAVHSPNDQERLVR